MSLYKGDKLIAGNNGVGVGKSETVLWSGTPTNTKSFVFNLKDDFTNYDELTFVFSYNTKAMAPNLTISSNDLYETSSAYPSGNYGYHVLYSSYDAEYIGVSVKTKTQLAIELTSTTVNAKIAKIIGVKYARQIQTNPASYSTGEQVIGTWIDGKPLYRKVVEYKTSPNSVKIPVDNYDTIYLGDASFVELKANGDTYVTKSYWSSSTDFVRFGLRKTSSTVLYSSGSTFSFVRAVYEFIYTKTTD